MCFDRMVYYNAPAYTSLLVMNFDFQLTFSCPHKKKKEVKKNLKIVIIDGIKKKTLRNRKAISKIGFQKF